MSERCILCASRLLLVASLAALPQLAVAAEPAAGESVAPAAAGDPSAVPEAAATAADPSAPAPSHGGAEAADEPETRSEVAEAPAAPTRPAEPPTLAPAADPEPLPYSPPPIAGADSSPADAPEETTGTDWQFVGGIIAGAAGVTFLVVGHYALFRLNDAVREDEMRSYRAGVPEGESSCDAARAGFVSTADGAASPGAVEDLCDEAEALEVVRNVALPVGAAATLVGLLLIGTSDTVNGPSRGEEQARAWRLQVGAGPAGAAAALTVSF